MMDHTKKALIDEVNCDVNGFIVAGAEDCEERIYDLSGKEIIDGNATK